VQLRAPHPESPPTTHATNSEIWVKNRQQFLLRERISSGFLATLRFGQRVGPDKRGNPAEGHSLNEMTSDHRRIRRIRRGRPSRVASFHLTIISTSTALLNGRAAIPTADRACLPIVSSKTRTIKSENPFITFGWSPRSQAEATREKLALRIIDIAKQGERDVDRLRDETLDHLARTTSERSNRRYTGL
jgi:hypothetical protein